MDSAEIVLYLLLKSISPNFFRKAKSCWRRAFGEKITVQFHQYLAHLNLLEMRAEICQTPFAKKASCARKIRAQMLMKSTPGEVVAFVEKAVWKKMAGH